MIATAQTAPADLLGLKNDDAEVAVLRAMREDVRASLEVIGWLEPEDFLDPRHALVFESIKMLLLGVEPLDTAGILAGCQALIRDRKLKISIDETYIDNLDHGDTRRLVMYAQTVKKLAWLRRAGDFAYWLVQELQERPKPDELFTAAQERWQMLAPKTREERFIYGWDTLASHAETIRARVQHHKQGDLLRYDWPWSSWNHLMRPLQPGFVGILSAADGMGKTMYLEEIAEYWASKGIHVVYVHLEDNRQYKFDRRLARRARVTIDKIQDGDFTTEELERVKQAQGRMEAWAGYLHYYDAAGESMTTIVRELESKVAEGVCQAVVLDYIDKVQPSRGQVNLYANNAWERQANDMEQLKVFTTKQGITTLTATQGNKAMQGSGTQTRANIQGSGQKSQKSQLVVILTRDMVGEEGLRDGAGNLLAGPGEYSPVVKVRVDKQNIGRTGDFRQFVEGQYFTVRDIQVERRPLVEEPVNSNTAEPATPWQYKDE